jgi:hypothetical protein
MTLIVEDGTQKTDSESYASVADADTYVTRWHDDADWNAATDAVKERALLKGTRFVDSFHFIGQMTDPDQALSWPRAFVGAIDGRVISSEEIPRAIKEATMEAALREVRGDSLFVDHDGGTVKREMKQVGDLRKETEFANPRSAGKTFEAIRALLRPYLQITRGLQRTL